MRDRTSLAVSGGTEKAAGRSLASMAKALLASVVRHGIRSQVISALALKPRGGIANDVLVPRKISGQLQLEWRARNVHPWDHDLPPARQAQMLREQTLCDAESALLRLFEALPEIERIDVRVLDPHEPDRIILEGVVDRGDVPASQISSSIEMRVKMLGLRYCQCKEA